jgi:hypothetical protein
VDTRGNRDNANASQNLIDAANGQQVHTSCYENAPCTLVALSPALLAGIETLAISHTISISEIASGSHAVGSSHYNGNSMDVNNVDGDPVIRMSEAHVNVFRDAAFAAGATTVYDPYHDPYGGHSNHFHIQW